MGKKNFSNGDSVQDRDAVAFLFLRMSIVEILPDPAFYFPPRNGRFTVTPGLFPLGTDFGNGDDDARLFQFDTAFPLYRANKIACINERWSKYVCADDFPAETAAPVIRLITEQLTIEYPTLFERNGPNLLHCRLTNETISLASPDVSAFDALCRQIPEDIAIVRRTKSAGRMGRRPAPLCAEPLGGGREDRQAVCRGSRPDSPL